VQNRNSQTLTRLLGDGAGHLVASGTFALLGVPSLFVLADLDGDGWQDAVTGCYNAAEFMVTPGVAGGSFGPAFAQPVSDVTPAIAVANLDADAIPDVIVLDYYSNRYEVLRGTGAFTFAPPQFFGAARSAYGIAVGDLNGGGKPDLVTIAPYGVLSVHMGNGDGTFGGVSDLAM